VAIRLHDERADGYVAILLHLLRVARPGAHYPDARRLAAHVARLGPAGSHGVHRTLDVDPVSGLPTLRHLLRVHAEREVALAARAAGEPWPAARRAHYAALAADEVVPPSRVDVRLRRREGRTSFLEVVHDRIDGASGCFVRFTVHLRQARSRVARVTEDDTTEPTERFVALMERHAGADAELALLLLSDVAGVRVEEVVRGQIGPLSFDGAEVPPLLAPVIGSVPGAFVLHLVLDRAGADVADDHCRDPLSRLYRDTLGGAARAAVEEKRRGLGYHVARDRRLVCTPGTEPALRATLARAGAKVVVRSA
jgi:hypothetical protein